MLFINYIARSTGTFRHLACGSATGALLFVIMLCLTVLGGPPLAQAAPFPDSRSQTGITVSETPGNSAENRAADQRLAQQIEARLEADRWVLSYEIRATIQHQVATLEGKVDTLLAKQRAAQLAGAVPGVRRVNNNILVSQPRREDPVIEDQVRALFTQDPALNSYREEVTVKDGFVILSGPVGSEYREKLAEMVAKSVPGVRGVENQLRVDRLGLRSDDEILADVESRIKWDPALRNPQVKVEVQNGAVALRGTVENPRAKTQVLQDARVAGVKSVSDRALRVLGKDDSGASSDGSNVSDE